MTKQLFNLRIGNVIDGTSTLEPMSGYAFKIEDIELFVHRSKDNTSYWAVTEKSTGMLAVRSATTRKEAIAQAQKTIIDDVGYTTTKQTIANALQHITVTSEHEQSIDYSLNTRGWEPYV